MNYLERILILLAETGGFGDLVMAPNAPPVVRKSDGMNVALNTVFTAEDIHETLVALKGRCQTADTSLAGSGTFSFGIAAKGRFRVDYVSQRGSKVVCVRCIPYAIPAIESICDESEKTKRLAELLCSPGGGVLVLFGGDSLACGTFVYSLLKQLNRTRRMVLYILERRLTFLMSHDNSVVIQTEVGIDVPSLAEGIGNALLMRPDITYVGDVRQNDELPGLLEAAECTMWVVVSSVAQSREVLLKRLRGQFDDSAGSLDQLIGEIVTVTREGDKLNVELLGRVQPVLGRKSLPLR